MRPRAPEPALVALAAVLAAFAALLALHLGEPRALVFDETHYVPAADALARLQGDLNWEHPPLSKWLQGLGARALAAVGLARGVTAQRAVTAAAGLWALASVGGILRDLGVRPLQATCAVALTGANVLWFVQSRTAMPDVFAVAFALAGLRRVRRDAGPRALVGWAELGLAMASKWSAAPLCALAVLWARAPAPGAAAALRARAVGAATAVAAYALPFLPLALLARDATPPWRILDYQLKMLDGFGRVDLSHHPYVSRSWQWPTLLRPIWYHFERDPAGDRYVWAGGNPLLFALALPAAAWLVARVVRRRAARDERAVALLYLAPLLFWTALPRAQLFYYFLPASLWLGPIVAWAVARLAGRRAVPALLGVTAACVALFLWFGPLLDGRLSPRDSYGAYMWLRGWR